MNSPTLFAVPTEHVAPAPALAPGECRVWWADPADEPVENLVGALSATELKRAATYRREQDRRRFLTACWLLRAAAAEQLGVSPAAVPVVRRCPDCDKPHGRPYILGDAGLHASISHSGSRVAVALTTAGPVGVDVEEVPDAPVSELVRCALTRSEKIALAMLPEREQHAAFARMWTRKEAVLKATGHGLRIPPDQVEVSDPWDEPELLSWPLDVAPETLRMSDVHPGAGYAAVVAVITEDTPIFVTEYTAADLRGSTSAAALPVAA
ncbi:4'-phosphopantetheinyl transferase [Sphaerisporangium rufum]|uniref:4'-phosphopantetheinyl transferase n=1 Tax=Sphaerisporangium rufum TaxID=1381558 RepID=A0A919R0R6_9ACTN|nr:4'-phosphopantetheinyl transferase superfamily protein [Sphaerisporangium rufum]GII76291.1 4'-phosphopantetheinyl transferase [Sphaerisporangium rufum]